MYFSRVYLWRNDSRAASATTRCITIQPKLQPAIFNIEIQMKRVRGEERHQQKWNQQEPLQNEIWYKGIMDKIKRDHPIKAPMDLATTHKLTLAIVNLAEKRDHMRWANETNCYLELKGEGPICNKLVPIMHAAVLSVRGGDGLIWRKRSLRRTKTSQIPEKIFFVILS